MGGTSSCWFSCFAFSSGVTFFLCTGEDVGEAAGESGTRKLGLRVLALSRGPQQPPKPPKKSDQIELDSTVFG